MLANCNRASLNQLCTLFPLFSSPRTYGEVSFFIFLELSQLVLSPNVRAPTDKFARLYLCNYSHYSNLNESYVFCSFAYAFFQSPATFPMSAYLRESSTSKHFITNLILSDLSLLILY
jgi:hypothetical protein